MVIINNIKYSYERKNEYLHIYAYIHNKITSHWIDVMECKKDKINAFGFDDAFVS